MVDKPLIRVTGLLTWQECRYRYRLSQSLRRKPHEGSGLSPQMSGSAIHFGIEAGLAAEAGRDRRAVAHEAANTYLDRFGADRYRNGVHTALDGVPEEVWAATNPQSEQRITVEYGDFTLTGKPDYWTYEPDAIIITDFKSTSKDEQDRLDRLQLFNMQPRFYAVLLATWLMLNGHKPPPFYTRHLVLSTRGKHLLGAPWLLTDEVFEASHQMMLRLAHEIAAAGVTSFIDATVSSSCAWCEFQDLCTGHLTGADVGSIIKEQYTEEEASL